MFKNLSLVIAGAYLAAPLTAHADFNYQETTQITGGSILNIMKMAGVFSSDARKAGQAVTSTVYLKGNRMARVLPDSTEIVDLDAQTFTHIDHLRRVYTVTTFAQMKEQMQRAAEAAEKQQASSPPSSSTASTPPGATTRNIDTSFDVHVRDTGASKQVSGLATKEEILTMALVAQDKTTLQKGALAITNDMWMAPEVPGYDQVRQFNQRFIEKLGQPYGGMSMQTMMTQPAAAKGLVGLATEVSKLQGIPIMQIMRMGSTADGKPLPAASEAALPASSGPVMPSASEIARKTAASEVSSRLGGLGSALGGGFRGFGRQQKTQTQQDASNAGNQASNAAANRVNTDLTSQSGAAASGPNGQTATVFMESSTTMSGFSTASVDDSRFAVPAGYQEDQPKLMYK